MSDGEKPFKTTIIVGMRNKEFRNVKKFELTYHFISISQEFSWDERMIDYRKGTYLHEFFSRLFVSTLYTYIDTDVRQLVTATRHQSPNCTNFVTYY